MDNTIVCLLVFIIVREVIFWNTAQKLVNKLMSRNYYDYKSTEQLSNKEQAKPVFQEQEEELDPAEVNGRLQGIGLL